MPSPAAAKRRKTSEQKHRLRRDNYGSSCLSFFLSYFLFGIFLSSCFLLVFIATPFSLRFVPVCVCVCALLETPPFLPPPSGKTAAIMASDIEAATALKAQGNKAFAQHDWPKAVDFYTQAIEKYDKEPSFYCNRAQVRPNQGPCMME